MKDIDEILSRFQGVRQVAGKNKWEVCCPAHDDRNASAYVELKDDGWVRMGCSAGSCTETDIREAIGLMHNNDLYLGERRGSDRPAVQRSSQPAAKPKAKRGDLERSYYYYDVEGFQVGRKDRFKPPAEGGKKTFLWFKYDEAGGTYTAGLDHTSRPLYQAHKLRSAINNDDVILFVEGEKCVEAVENWGMVATTLPDGAGSHWTTEQAEMLRGANVIILPDNDEPGQRYANDAVDKLTGVAKTLKILYLPGIDKLGNKADLADWQLAGHTKDELLNAIDAIKNDSAENVPQYIKRLNFDHAVVLLPKPGIIKERRDKTGNVVDIKLWNPKEFELAYANDKIEILDTKGKPKAVPVSRLWIEHKHRRQYSEVVFEPSGCDPDQYNLWRGFAVQPKQGDWSLMQQHILDNICCGNKGHYNYLLNWMARVCQDPGGLRPGVAIVLRGREGTGKGTFVSNFGELFGPHFIPIHNSTLLTGRFTEHLKSALVIFLDEAMWAGDKAAEGVLKGIITEPERVVEPKGKAAYKVANHANILMASNNDWVVPAGPDARRFFVLNVNDEQKQNSEYFGEIKRQMTNGGREAMLFDLLERDLSGVELRNFERTEALAEQIENTLSSVGKFWEDCLMRGFIVSETERWDHDGFDFDASGRWIDVKVKDIIDEYLSWCRRMNVRYPESESKFGKCLRQFIPVERSLKRDGSMARSYYYSFPSLKECRRSFERVIGAAINWDEDEVPF